MHVIIATPGRIPDLMENRPPPTPPCPPPTPDGAAKLLSQDFKGLLDKVISFLPQDRQILLYSAKFPLTVEQFMKQHLHSPYEINLMNELTLKGVTQYYAFVQERQKVHCLNTLFSKVSPTWPSIIFCNSTQRVELLAKKITELCYSCYYIHAKMLQGSATTCSTTSAPASAGTYTLRKKDLFTRGIDIQAVNLVITSTSPRWRRHTCTGSVGPGASATGTSAST
ncbi:unnamed protein product [Ixodes persulcatus]